MKCFFFQELAFLVPVVPILPFKAELEVSKFLHYPINCHNINSFQCMHCLDNLCIRLTIIIQFYSICVMFFCQVQTKYGDSEITPKYGSANIPCTSIFHFPFFLMVWRDIQKQKYSYNRYYSGNFSKGKRGGEGSEPPTLNNKKPPKRGREISYVVIPVFFSRLFCLYLFISSFFNLVCGRWGGWSGGPPPKFWVKLVRFRAIIHHLTHTISHGGRVWISN